MERKRRKWRFVLFSILKNDYLGDRSHKQPLVNLKRKIPEFVIGGKPIESKGRNNVFL